MKLKKWVKGSWDDGSKDSWWRLQVSVSDNFICLLKTRDKWTTSWGSHDVRKRDRQSIPGHHHLIHVIRKKTDRCETRLWGVDDRKAQSMKRLHLHLLCMKMKFDEKTTSSHPSFHVKIYWWWSMMCVQERFHKTNKNMISHLLPWQCNDVMSYLSCWERYECSSFSHGMIHCLIFVLS